MYKRNIILALLVLSTVALCAAAIILNISHLIGLYVNIYLESIINAC